MLVIRQRITNTNITILLLIDYTKIQLLNIDVIRLLSLNYLDFKTLLSKKSGELGRKQVAVYHFCKIIVYDSGLVFFSGSIHKLHNSLNNIKAPNYKNQKQYKGYNGDQFTFKNIIEVRHHLQDLFNCEPHQMQFRNIEFGINTTPGFTPTFFIKGLLYHNGKMFEYRYNGNLAVSVHQQFIFKIYNKSNQYGMKANTLRIELKYLKMNEVKLIGIESFEDINEKTMEKAKQLLLRRFDEVVYYDYTIVKKGLRARQKQTLKYYSNPRYWLIDLKSIHRDRHKKKLEQFIKEYSQNLKQQLHQDIIQKCVIINRLSEKAKCVIINHSSIGLIITQKESKKSRKCKLTGVDISMQKEDSFLLSHTGIKYYLKNSKKVYSEIRNKYLSKKWENETIENQIKEIAHNIRNYQNNRKLKSERLYPEHQMQMF